MSFKIAPRVAITIFCEDESHAGKRWERTYEKAASDGPGMPWFERLPPTDGGDRPARGSKLERAWRLAWERWNQPNQTTQHLDAHYKDSGQVFPWLEIDYTDENEPRVMANGHQRFRFKCPHCSETVPVIEDKFFPILDRWRYFGQTEMTLLQLRDLASRSG